MKYLYISIICFFPLFNFGQSINTLSGKVLTEDNFPISNVHIQVEGTSIGTISNNQGVFTLKIPEGYCNENLIFSHIGYSSILEKISCDQNTYLIIMSERVFELEEVQVTALSAEQIIINTIKNINKNFQVDSVNYTMFSRFTEQIEDDPLLIEESVFYLYHEDKTKPDFNIIKVRGKGFNRLGKKRFEEARLIGIHSTESHLLLRYIPKFLKKKKMKKYKYNLISENNSYYVISIDSDEYLKGGVLHIDKNDFGISYLEEIYQDENWNDMSKTNTKYESYFAADQNKWFFTHGSISMIWYLKKENIEIKSTRITVATERSKNRAFDKRDEMGLMSQMLKDFTSDFNDEFWEEYNFIPLEEKFKSSLTDAKK